MKFLKLIIPCYNAEKVISKMLDSILSQTCRDFFIVAVDDMSVDNTFGILKDYEQKFPEYIKAVQVPEKAFADGARKYAFEQYEDAEFTWFVDADDELADNNVIQCLKDLHVDKQLDLYTFNSSLYKFEFGKIWLAPWFRITRSDLVVFHVLNIKCANDMIQTILQFDKIPDEKIYHLNSVLYKYSGRHIDYNEYKKVDVKIHQVLKDLQLNKNEIKQFVKNFKI